MTPTWVELAFLVARTAHRGQVDKLGEPYILHPLEVGRAVRHLGPVHEAAAYLHDVLEDTAVTVEDLRARGIPTEVIETVEVLTHRKGEPRVDYYARVREHPVALAVKRADVAHNSSPERLAGLDPETRDRLERKYAGARHALAVATLARDITAKDLAVDSIEPGEGYPPNHVIGPAGSAVTILDADPVDDWVEVTDFANDRDVAGFVHRSYLTN